MSIFSIIITVQIVAYGHLSNAFQLVELMK